MKQNDDFGVFEIGMDKKGEINYLSKIIRPDLGVITNISYAHSKNFKNIKQIADAKAEIINNIKKDGRIKIIGIDQNNEIKGKLEKKETILDFVSFTNASYSGGILITDWFSGNANSEENSRRDLKITVRFLSNEIRADGIKVIIHEKICSCLLYTSPSPRDATLSRMPSSA